MLSKVLFGFSFLAFVGAGITAVAWQPDSGRELKVYDGTTSISFLPSVLEANGLRIDFKETSGIQAESGEPSIGFRIAPSSMKFLLVDGRFDRIEEGTISHESGFTLTSGVRRLDATNFTLRENGRDFDIVVGAGRNAFVAFELRYPRHVWQDGQLLIGSMDMVLTPQGAAKLGKPGLTGQLLGTVGVTADAKPIDGKGAIAQQGGVMQPAGGTFRNVRISALSSLTSLGRTGTFPNGHNGMSMSTTSCNVGTENIPWNAPMQVTHPVISMNLYRVMNGRFEQIGMSWLKHGFLATNQNQCGTCQNPGTGALLGINCSDTYGTGNNGDRFYLGERKEVNPFTGVWTCTGSWFANYQPDCIRRNNGSGLDAVAHRLDVMDSDLNVSGATFFYEAYYISANDVDKYNNISHRPAAFTWTGSAWSVNNNIESAQTQGPAINRWGEMRNIAEPRDEGDVIVAVQTTNLGNGMYHYELAVYNHDLDREVKEFSLPVPVGTVLQNVGFRDVDQDGGNQWTNSFSGGVLKWTMGTTNTIKFSNVFNFWFDADMPPANASATLKQFKAGSAGDLSAVTRGPLVLTPISSYTIVNGAPLGGNLQSLGQRDGDRLSLTPILTSSLLGSGIETSSTAPAGTFTALTFGAVTSNTLLPSQATQKVYLWNWGSSAWEVVDSRPTTSADTPTIVKITSNPMRFINGSTREVRARVMHASILGDTTNRWTVFIDQVGLKYE